MGQRAGLDNGQVIFIGPENKLSIVSANGRALQSKTHHKQVLCGRNWPFQDTGFIGSLLLENSSR